MNGEKSKSVAIVGAGITGLTAAYELAKRGIQVEVFEAHHEVGGELAVLEVGGTLVERYYHHRSAAIIT
ncbi:MAG: FAD-dependent oxidoreductase [Chloroflexi bacterium]|nr:FAD-dependent oxidoreductase [Chloroflexota bacterium]